MLTKNNETFDVEAMLNSLVITKNADTSKTNLLQLAKVNNRELVVSNLYAYFLNPTENHGLGTIGMEALLGLCSQKFTGFTLDLSRLNIIREKSTGKDTNQLDENGEPTGNHNFIDLLITDGTRYLIIENKILANLTNDLDRYDTSVKTPEETKLKIVLCLKKVYNMKAGFFEITHQELYQQIEKRLAESKLTLSIRQWYNYQSFLEILKTHYTILENAQERINFFTANEQKIVQLNTQLHELRSHFIKRIKQIGQNAFVESELSTKNRDNDLIFFRAGTSLFGSIYLHEYTVNPIRVSIYIEGNKQWVDKWFLNEGSFQLEGFGKSYNLNEEGTSWALTIFKEYKVDTDNYEQTFEELALSLKNDWVNAYLELEKFFYSIDKVN